MTRRAERGAARCQVFFPRPIVPLCVDTRLLALRSASVGGHRAAATGFSSPLATALCPKGVGAFRLVHVRLKNGAVQLKDMLGQKSGQLSPILFQLDGDAEGYGVILVSSCTAHNLGGQTKSRETVL